MPSRIDAREADALTPCALLELSDRPCARSHARRQAGRSSRPGRRWVCPGPGLPRLSRAGSERRLHLDSNHSAKKLILTMRHKQMNALHRTKVARTIAMPPSLRWRAGPDCRCAGFLARCSPALKVCSAARRRFCDLCECSATQRRPSSARTAASRWHPSHLRNDHATGSHAVLTLGAGMRQHPQRW